QDRKGIWEVGANHNAFALMGGIDIDLRQAIFSTREVVINASTVMGGIDIIVNAFTRVSVEGVGIMGAFDEMPPKVAAELRDDSPLVRVRGAAIMGAVEVQRKSAPA
ncbi:MAG: LiaF domain-containing protein, partial [Microbacteriaceae bacterium]